MPTIATFNTVLSAKASTQPIKDIIAKIYLVSVRPFVGLGLSFIPTFEVFMIVFGLHVLCFSNTNVVSASDNTD